MHIEYDNVASSLSSDVDGLTAWRQSRSVAVDELERQLKESPSLVIMDDNFHLRSMRKTIYRQCQNHVVAGMVIYTGVLFLDTPIEMCIYRNRQRGVKDRVADTVITKMNVAMEPPDASKSKWDSNAIRVDGKSFHFSMIIEWLIKVENGVPLEQQPPLTVQAEQDGTISHQETRMNLYDQILRRWVGHVASINKQSTMVANSARKNLLKELRSGQDKATNVMAGEFCDAVCNGWSVEQVEALRRTLREWL